MSNFSCTDWDEMNMFILSKPFYGSGSNIAISWLIVPWDEDSSLIFCLFCVTISNFSGFVVGYTKIYHLGSCFTLRLLWKTKIKIIPWSNSYFGLLSMDVTKELYNFFWLGHTKIICNHSYNNWWRW